MADNHRLLELAKDGDRDARDKLVTDNMGLVVSVARRYVGRGQELEDLIQIGLIGLVKAIDRFDMDYEVKLSTYAVPLIQGEIRRFLRDDGMVKVSRNLKTIYYRADRYRHEVEKNRGTEPGMEEICEAIGATPEELVMAMDAASDVTCIDDLHAEMCGTEDGDRIVDRLCVSQLLDTLTPDERKLVVLSPNPDIKYGVEKLELMSFSGSKEQQVISVMYILQVIQEHYPDCQTQTIGATDVVVYYRTYDTSDKVKQFFKFLMICFIAFFGAGFSIMSYNSDVNMVGQLDVMHNIFVGQGRDAYPVAGIAYSLGLFIGIIVFFNHGAKKKFSDDPTPLQVQMRQYEQEVNQTVITDASRKKAERDAD